MAGRFATARQAARDLDGGLGRCLGLELLENRVRFDRAYVRLTKFSDYLEPYAGVPSVLEFRDRLQALPTVA